MLVAEFVKANAEQDLILEEVVVDPEGGPLEVLDEGVGVGEMLRQVAADDGAVSKEIEGDFGPLRLQGLRHVTKTCADLNL